MQTPERILAAHRLKLDASLRRTHGKRVYLLSNNLGSKYILKAYDSPSWRLARERDFLSTTNDIEFHYIKLPRLIDHDRDYILLSFVDREYHTRETILKRGWELDDVKLWVKGIIEFQNISVSKAMFSLNSRIKGDIYPVLRLGALLPRCHMVFRSDEIVTIVRLMMQYIGTRLSTHNLLTHYDLQTYNYSFAIAERKMSILDFEIPYFKGDPLYDVIYFISIPIQHIKDWTFQKQILLHYLNERYSREWPCKSVAMRIRLILVLCNLMRYFCFFNDHRCRAIYHRNMKLLLDPECFREWLRDLSGRKSTD